MPKCSTLIKKQMLEKVFCFNIPPSLASGSHIFHKAEYMGCQKTYKISDINPIRMKYRMCVCFSSSVAIIRLLSLITCCITEKPHGPAPPVQLFACLCVLVSVRTFRDCVPVPLCVLRQSLLTLGIAGLIAHGSAALIPP